MIQTQSNRPTSVNIAVSIAASLVLGVTLLGGCQAPAPSEPPLVVETPPVDIPAETAKSEPPTDPRVAQLLEEMTVAREENVAGARHALKIARRHMGEARFADAREKAREAYRLDPSNDEARQLLDELGFMLGDRKHEIAIVAKELGEMEQVRRRVKAADLNRWYAEGNKLLAEGKPDEAAKLFQRIVDHIEWFKLDRDEKFKKIMKELQAEQPQTNELQDSF